MNQVRHQQVKLNEALGACGLGIVGIASVAAVSQCHCRHDRDDDLIIDLNDVLWCTGGELGLECKRHVGG